MPCDIRDIIADIKNLAETDRVRWDLIGMLALDLIGLIPVIGALKYSDEVGTLFKNAGKVSVVAEGADGVGAVTRHADEAGAWLQGVKVFRYSDETAEAVASGEKLLKESQTVYESFADMMSPDDATKYLDFLENGSKEGLTSAELAGVEKADVLLVSQKVGYEDVWDLRNAGDMLESGTTTLQTGGRQIDYNAYIKRLETIDMEYENIRIDTTDISKIAQNTGMPEWKISRIKDHVFSNEHILDAGVKRFDADPEIADAWYRLTNGTYNQNDIDLLNHEYFESKFESFYKTDYRTAHNKTEESGRIWDPYKENN